MAVALRKRFVANLTKNLAGALSLQCSKKSEKMRSWQFNAILTLLAVGTVLVCSCSTQHERAVTVEAGQLWQNGEALYQVEDSGSVWNLYGGTLHEGGFEMKLPKSGEWQLVTTAGKTALVLKENGKATDVLLLVDGKRCTARDSMYACVTTALDSAQAHGIKALLRGTYRAEDGQTWHFADSTVTIGKTKKTYHLGKSLDMYDRVTTIDGDTTAFAYTFYSPRHMKLVPARYSDDPGAYSYFLDDENGTLLTSTQKDRFAKMLDEQLVPQYWVRYMISGFSHGQRVAFLNSLKAKSGNNTTLKTNIEILEAAIKAVEREES
jgi:hypothetical protein